MVAKIGSICNHGGASLYSLMDFAQVVPTLLTVKIFKEKHAVPSCVVAELCTRRIGSSNRLCTLLANHMLTKG